MQQGCYQQAWGAYGVDTQRGTTEAKRGGYEDLSELHEEEGQRRDLGRREEA